MDAYGGIKVLLGRPQAYSYPVSLGDLAGIWTQDVEAQYSILNEAHQCRGGGGGGGGGGRGGGMSTEVCKFILTTHGCISKTTHMCTAYVHVPSLVHLHVA